MKNIMNKFAILTALILSFVIVSSCSEWTETESLSIENPTLEAINPKLYAEYLASLRRYKTSPHKIVYVTMPAAITTPKHRNEHLTVVPDSVDYICINIDSIVDAIVVQEKDEIYAEKGTKTIASVSYDKIRDEWEKIIEIENVEKPDTTMDEEAKEKKLEERWLVYLTSQVNQQISYCEKYNLHGLEFAYSGKSYLSMTPEEFSVDSLRQKNYFDIIEKWIVDNSNKELVFKGSPDNLINKSILQKTKLIIIPAISAKSVNELSIATDLAVADGVPTDRFLVEVTAVPIGSNDDKIGLLADVDSSGNNITAIEGSAAWVLNETPDYVRLGVAIQNVQWDYYNVELSYKNTRNTISTINPNF